MLRSMQKFSPQTTSFIFLSSLALFGGFLVILISSQVLKNEVYYVQDPNYQENSNYSPIPTASASEELVLPDTRNWEDHRYNVYGISFKTPKGWKVALPKKQGNFFVGEIDPGAKFENIRIYISEKDYFVMQDLPTKNDTVGGQPALNVSDLLYGVWANNFYFTFDIGRSVSLKPEFNAIVKSVEFFQ